MERQSLLVSRPGRPLVNAPLPTADEFGVRRRFCARNPSNGFASGSWVAKDIGAMPLQAISIDAL